MRKSILVLALVLCSFNLFAQWTNQNISSNYTLTDISFVDYNHGWITGWNTQNYYNADFTSADGGTNWTLNGWDYQKVLFINPNIG